MTTPASSVAALKVPTPVTTADAPVVDPTVSGFLAYLAYWTQYALSPVLQVMTAPPVPDACPTSNQYACNPSSLVARFLRPALFVWWDGKSVYKPWTTIKDVRIRDIHALYVFDRLGSDQIAGVDARQRYAGLMSTVDAAWLRAISRRAHPSFALPGFRLGTAIGIQLGLNDIAYVGGQEGFLQEQATASARNAAVTSGPTRLSKGNANGIVQGYPSLHGVFRVTEEAGQDTAQPSDTMGNVYLAPSVGQDPSAPLQLDERYLPSADVLPDPFD